MESNIHYYGKESSEKEQVSKDSTSSVDKKTRDFVKELLENTLQSSMTATKTYDTSSLESALEQIKDQEHLFPEEQRGLIHKIIDGAQQLYGLLSGQADLQTRSARELRIQRKRLLHQQEDLHKQQTHIEKNLSLLYSQITKYSQDVDLENTKRSEFAKDISKREENLLGLKAYVLETTDENEKENLEVAKQQYVLETENLKDQLSLQEDILANCTYFRDDLVEEKRLQENYRRVLQYNSQVIENETKRIAYYLKRESHKSMIQSVLESKIIRGKFYNVQQKLIDREQEQNNLYNRSLEKLPSEKDLAENLIHRRRNVPHIKK